MMVTFKNLTFNTNPFEKYIKVISSLVNQERIQEQLEACIGQVPPPDNHKRAQEQLEVINKAISPTDNIKRDQEQIKEISKVVPILDQKSLYEPSVEELSKVVQPLEFSKERTLRQLRLEKLGFKFSSELQKKSLLSKTSGNSLDLRRTSDLIQQEKQNPSQTAEKSQTTPASRKKIIIRGHGKLLKQVLLEIYYQTTRNNNNPVKWSPSNWFGEGVITRSIRACWSNTLRSLFKKGLVEIIEPKRKFSNNRGKAAPDVFLTSDGYQLAIQLMEND